MRWYRGIKLGSTGPAKLVRGTPGGSLHPVELRLSKGMLVHYDLGFNRWHFNALGIELEIEN